jgi:hypothetical protein
MGGPGSGRHGGFRMGNRYARDADNPAGLSRVELEPRMARDVEVGTPETLTEAEAIWTELGARVWQGTNPYAGPPPWA